MKGVETVEIRLPVTRHHGDTLCNLLCSSGNRPWQWKNTFIFLQNRVICDIWFDIVFTKQFNGKSNDRSFNPYVLFKAVYVHAGMWYCDGFTFQLFTTFSINPRGWKAAISRLLKYVTRHKLTTTSMASHRIVFYHVTVWLHIRVFHKTIRHTFIPGELIFYLFRSWWNYVTLCDHVCLIFLPVTHLRSCPISSLICHNQHIPCRLYTSCLYAKLISINMMNIITSMTWSWACLHK